MWRGRPRPRTALGNGRGRPFYNGGLPPEHRYERGLANVEDGCEAGSKNRDVREAKKCGAGVPARAPHWTTGEDARFTMAVCHESIAIRGAGPT
jgi:hypothetical protein